MTREERWAIDSIIQSLCLDIIKAKYESDNCLMQRIGNIDVLDTLEKSSDKIDAMCIQARERLRRVWKAQGDTALLEEIEKECFNYGHKD